MSEKAEPACGAEPTALWCAAVLTNHRELVADLDVNDVTTDEDVLLSAVGRWGDEAREHLRGAWAYAVRDRATGAVTITRDQLGIMPAYWAWDSDGRLHVSDSIEVIAASASIDLVPDPEYARALELRSVGQVPTGTAVMGIHRVPPGSAVRITCGEGEVTRWWRPEAAPRVRRISVDVAAGQLRTLLVATVDDAVEACLRVSGQQQQPPPSSDIAAHLSGGLDSTAVALMAQAALQRRGRRLACAASWSPDRLSFPVLADAQAPPAYDERELVEELARDAGVPVVFGPAELGEAEWLSGLDPALQPRQTLARESYLLPAVASRGTHHVLSGWGGDEFASFNGRMATRALVRGLRLGPVREVYRDLRARGRSPLRAGTDLIGAALPAGAHPRRRGSHRDRQVRREQRVAAAAAQFPELAARVRESRAALSNAADPRSFQLALLDLGHLSARIESWHEAGRRFGVRYHYPLLDVRLVEWALSMPPEVFRVGQHSRRVFRQALVGLVPDWVRLTVKDDPVLLGMVRAMRESRTDDDA